MAIVQDPAVLSEKSLRERLRAELIAFEQIYGIDSETFYRQYEAGKLGDSMDFVEWSSTVEMLNSLKSRENSE